eukprot:CAMPEP_0204826404 /NCGR_PEP_ID=MMETSP1346-20131115/4091_1 /ASSEMBLY_ACC=CAM_ASM_000771 /TAXON_ID=215587 /ORGANISM="Aplanochytrium stocchinoi, Strain GSBS06" /LENGTH=518 /DNA_ID=CAMNT_0051954407 /DNA_START=189 /DNA_END=1745 /DNA_ORIENTATION=+
MSSTKDSEGVIFPAQGKDGGVSTTQTGKAVLASSIERISPECAQRIFDEKDWRNNYTDRITEVVAISAESKENALTGAQDGLTYVYDKFMYESNGERVKLSMIKNLVPEFPVFATETVVGSRYDTAVFNPSITVHDEQISGQELKTFTKDLVARDYIENSAAVKSDWVIEHKDDVQKDLEKLVFVVFGAGAALGPFQHLLRLGKISVVAVDVPVEPVWEGLMNSINNSSAKVHIPRLGNSRGCDLIKQAPEIIRWLSDLEPGKRMVIGNYAYADSANFIKVTLAMDAICAAVAEFRGRDRIAFSYLCSPTDIFTAPDEVVKCSREKYNALSFSSLFRPWLNPLSGGRFFTPNFAPDSNIVDCVIMQQGPNYALAKRIQHWRAIIMREKGYIVSSNIAPASRTESVMKQKLLKAAYDGSAYFDINIFDPKTANSLMTLLLLHDVCNPRAGEHIKHPFDLFSDGCCHGGMWRNPHRARSITEIAAVLNLMNQYKGPALFVCGLLYGAARTSRSARLTSKI